MRRLYFVALLAGCGRVGFESEPRAVDAVPPDDAFDRCDSTVSDDTVALFTFESSLTSDATMQHDATNMGAATATNATCGTGAASFAGGSHLVIPDSPAFDLPNGSIELYVRARNPANNTQGLLARDAVGNDFDGHLSIGLAPSGQVWVRIQRASGAMLFRCSEPIAADTWTHVATSFGANGFRLWIDGTPQTAAMARVVLTSGEHSCTEPSVFGIDGNDNTIVIGALNLFSPNNTPTPTVDDPLTGEIDQVRIRSAWRDFTR